MYVAAFLNPCTLFHVALSINYRHSSPFLKRQRFFYFISGVRMRTQAAYAGMWIWPFSISYSILEQIILKHFKTCFLQPNQIKYNYYYLSYDAILYIFLCLNTLEYFNLTSFFEILYHYAHKYRTIKHLTQTKSFITEFFCRPITTYWKHTHKLICIDARAFIMNSLYFERALIKLKQKCSKGDNLIYGLYLMNCSLQSSCKHSSPWKNYILIRTKVSKDNFCRLNINLFVKLCKCNQPTLM